MAYTLITANRNYSSWSLRPWLLMKALGIVFVDRLEPFTKPNNYSEFRAFSPTGQVPVLIDDGSIIQPAIHSTIHSTIHDTLGITMYLAERHDGVWPAQEAARPWAMCAVAEMHGGFSALRNECTMNVGVRMKPRPISDALQRDIARIAELWNEGLSRFGGPYLTGAAFTAADAFFAPVAYRVRTYDLDVGAAGQAWVDHIIAHPAMQIWEADALKETWREVSHEEDLLSCGEVIADYRS